MAKQGRAGRRCARQDAWRKYARAREDVQLMGLLPTIPEVAAQGKRTDRVFVVEREELSALDRAAINQGWATPKEQQPLVIQRLIAKMFDENTSVAESVMCANALLKADQMQFARDNPELAGKAKGGTTVQITATDIADYLQRIKAQREVGDDPPG